MAQLSTAAWLQAALLSVHSMSPHRRRMRCGSKMWGSSRGWLLSYNLPPVLQAEGGLGSRRGAGELRIAAFHQAALRSCAASLNPATRLWRHCPWAFAGIVSALFSPPAGPSCRHSQLQLARNYACQGCVVRAVRRAWAMQCWSDPGWPCMPLGCLPCANSQPGPAQ